MSVLGLEFSSHLRAGVNASRFGEFLLVAVLACGLAVAFGAPSAKADFVSGLPDDVEVGNVDPESFVAWFDADYECTHGACNDESVIEAIESLLNTDVLELEYIRTEYNDEGGQISEFMYDGVARSVFAVKSGLTMLVLVFDTAVTGWTVSGLPHDVSNVSGVSPIPLPPAALLFLSGLAGMALLARGRRRRAKSASVAAL